MKKVISAAILLGFIAAACTGCRRNQVDPSPTPTLSQLIVGKWTVQTATGHYVANGSDRSDTTNFTSADYVDFKSNGTVDIMIAGVAYSGNWQITNSKLLISNTNYLDNGGQPYDLPILNSHELKMDYIETDPSNFLEQTLTLSK